MTALLFENGQIKLEQRAQEGDDSYHVALFQFKSGWLYTSTFEGRFKGIDVNRGDEIHAPPNNPLTRLYQGLNKDVAFRIGRLLSKAHIYYQRDAISADTLIKYIDGQLIRQGEAGIELALVEDKNFLYGHAWKRKISEERCKGEK